MRSAKLVATKPGEMIATTLLFVADIFLFPISACLDKRWSLEKRSSRKDGQVTSQLHHLSTPKELRPLHHHGTGPFSSENVPVGPSWPRSASRTGSRAASSTVRVPWKLFKSVAVKPGHAALTLMRVDSRSAANASVIALSAVFDAE